jgi:hypothetical protein
MSFYCILFVNCAMSNELLSLALCIIIMTVSISIKIQWKANKYVCMYSILVDKTMYNKGQNSNKKSNIFNYVFPF